jgi:hypothetical protein
LRFDGGLANKGINRTSNRVIQIDQFQTSGEPDELLCGPAFTMDPIGMEWRSTPRQGVVRLIAQSVTLRSTRRATMLRQAIMVIAILLLVSTAAAHPGHGEAGEGFSLAHYLTEPIHALGALGVLVIVAASAYAVRHVQRCGTPLAQDR